MSSLHLAAGFTVTLGLGLCSLLFWGAHTAIPRNVAVLAQAGSYSQAHAMCGILRTA